MPGTKPYVILWIRTIKHKVLLIKAFVSCFINPQKISQTPHRLFDGIIVLAGFLNQKLSNNCIWLTG
jgi:hypothetical protein